jgi:hypothetical protein
MFSVEIKVNGCMVVHIYGHNTGIPDAVYNLNDPLHLYSYEIYTLGEKKLSFGHVLHKQSNGLLTLIRKILEDAENGHRVDQGNPETD